MSRRDRWGWLALAVGAIACSATTTGSGESGGAAPGGAGAAGGETTLTVGGSGGAGECACMPGPHNELIYVLSDEAEIWGYDPVANELSYQATVLCSGNLPFSMSVDHLGQAWVLMASSGLVFTVDPAVAGDCAVSPYTPHQANFDLFGMAFAGELGGPSCPPLFVHSYSGAGPFSEGLNAGQLARVDPDSGELSVLGSIHYDGGELAGTADGRLFAFAGVNPAKLVEYDRDSAAVLSTTPLVGLSKTNASAFAFFAGDIYFFTEAVPVGCLDCLSTTCEATLLACHADAACAEQLACAIEQGGVSDDCGGLMPQPMVDCLVGTCGGACLVPSSVKVSQITHLDFDQSDGGGMITVYDQAPIRIVGAGSSVCVPQVPR